MIHTYVMNSFYSGLNIYKSKERIAQASDAMVQSEIVAQHVATCMSSLAPLSFPSCRTIIPSSHTVELPTCLSGTETGGELCDTS